MLPCAIDSGMRLGFALAVLLLCGACRNGSHDNSLPAVADIDRLERSLAAHPCVGALDQWERNYRFSRKDGLFSSHSLHPDFGVIEFHLRRVGNVSVAAGRKVMPQQPDGDWPDSSPIQSIDGKFTVRNGSLSLAPCRPAGAATPKG